MKKIRIAIIGTGSISNLHAQAYKKLPNVELVAACDINETNLKEFSEKYDIQRTYTDYNDLLKHETLDGISITAWNNAHAKLSIAALDAGINVLCEKPLAMNTSEALSMVAAAKASQKLLMVGFVRRFGANTIALKELIDNKELGDIYYAKAGCIRRWGNPGGWFSDKKRSGGGPVIDLGVHIIDLVRYLSGKPKAISVYASTFNKLGMKPDIKGVTKYCSTDYDTYNDVEDCATALIKFDNGMTLFFETSWAQNIKQDSLYVDFYGSKAGAQMEPVLEIFEDRNGYLANTNPILSPESYDFEHNFNEEIRHFVDCIENGTPCINPGEDGVEIMKILDAIYQSGELGHEVVL